MARSEAQNKAGLPRLILSLFFVSGACALVYELLWIRRLSLSFGSSVLALSTVLAVFMAGLALGSWGFGRSADRCGWGRSAAGLLKCFALLEAGIGLFAIVSPQLLTLCESIFLALSGSLGPSERAFLRLVLAFCVLLPPTALMGGSFPVLIKLFTRSPEELGRKVSALYSANTWGAVAGTVLTGFVFLFYLGFTPTLYLAAGLNLGIAALSWALAEQWPWPLEKKAPAQTPVEGPRLVLWAFALSGFTALAYEVTWARLLHLLMGSSIYAITVVLASFLLGIALGSFLIGRLMPRSGRLALFGGMQQALGLATLALVGLCGVLPQTFLWAYRSFPDSFPALQGSLFMLTAALLLIPTALLGACLPLAGALYVRSLNNLGACIGRLYAANTIGAMLGALAAGFVLIPALGLRGAFILLALSNIALGTVLLARAQVSRFRLASGSVALAAVLLILLLPGADPEILSGGIYTSGHRYPGAQAFVKKARERELLYYKEGLGATVAVRRLPGGLLSLSVDGKPEASTDPEMDLLTHRLLAHIPALLKPRAKRALVVGLGSGVTLGSLAAHPGLREIECAEIEPAVVEASRYFEAVNRRPLEDPRVRLHVADGRNHLLMSRKPYDIIVSAPSNPWISGPSSLYTREYYELAQSRLSPDGLMAVWFQSSALSEEDFKMGLRTFREVFPHASVWAGGGDVRILLGSPSPLKWDYAALSEALKSEEVARDLDGVGVRSPIELLAYFQFGPARFKAYAGAGPIHSDEKPLLEFSAPRHLYETGESLKILAGLRSHRESVSRYLRGFAGHEALARLYEGSELPRLAAEEFAAELKLFPQNLALRRRLGRLWMGLGEPRRALAELKHVAAQSSRPEDRLRLAQAYLMLKDSPQALKVLKRLAGGASFVEDLARLRAEVGSHGHSAAAYVYLARLYARLGQKSEAAGLYSRAMSMSPNALKVVLDRGQGRRDLRRDGR